MNTTKANREAQIKQAVERMQAHSKTVQRPMSVNELLSFLPKAK